MDKHEYDEQMKQLCKGNSNLVLADIQRKYIDHLEAENVHLAELAHCQAHRIHKLERKIAEMEEEG